MNNHAFSKIWIVVAVAVFAVAGIFSWQYFETQKEIEISEKKITEIEQPKEQDEKEIDENFILIETTIKGNKEMNCFYKDDVLKFSHSSLKIIDECRQKHNKIYRGLRTITTYNCYAKLVSGNCIEEDSFFWSSPCEVRGAASCLATIKKCPEQ